MFLACFLNSGDSHQLLALMAII